MPSPFPGMDPYLESPEIFPDLHAGLIPEIQHFLNPRLGSGYVARVELRVYIEQEDGEQERIPDIRVETSKRRNPMATPSTGGLLIAEPIIVPSFRPDPTEETYLTIRHRPSKSLVAVLEVMSPTNKVRGSEGLKSFMEKRHEILCSSTHWIEIDLLRKGSRPLPRLNQPTDYRVVVARGEDGSRPKCWPISIRQKLPVIGIPLRRKDPDVPLDLAAVFDAVYDGGAYERSIEYDKPPDPPLDPDVAKWANKLLRSKGLR
jgi:Protein of unknown function (DUF4058)